MALLSPQITRLTFSFVGYPVSCAFITRTLTVRWVIICRTLNFGLFFHVIKDVINLQDIKFIEDGLGYEKGWKFRNDYGKKTHFEDKYCRKSPFEDFCCGFLPPKFSSYRKQWLETCKLFVN